MLTFISYSRPSRDLVRELAKDLEGLGHTVWLDDDLSGGQAWWNTILAQIRACEVFVFSLTPDSLDSQACALEYTYAARLGKPILPILQADGVSMNVLPADLSAIQFVDYRRQDRGAVLALVKALSSLPAPRPLPDPLPDPPPVPLSYLGDLKNQIEAATPLTFEQQTALVLKLKERARQRESRDDARALLEALRRRDDLYAKVATEIDSVLGEARGAPSAEPPERPRSGARPAGPAAPPPRPRRWLAFPRWLLALDELIEYNDVRRRLWQRLRAEPSLGAAAVWLFGESRQHVLFLRIVLKWLLALLLIAATIRILSAT